MFESSHKLRHLPFFEFIASREETDPQWRMATAGLVVLRLVDAWADDGPAVLSGDSWATASVRSAIDDVDEATPIRSLLGRAIDALEQPRADLRHVLSPLVAFGQALEYEAQWALAVDVYQTVLRHVDPAGDADIAVAAQLRVGFCSSQLAQMDDASAAFDAAHDIATAAGDMVGVLNARIGHAKLNMLRGNFPRADEIYSETIRQAAGPGLEDVRSRALHGRSNVAHNRGDYELAVQLAYSALHLSQSARDRDRILADIAHAFLELGVYSAARDAYLVLSATAQEQFIRWSATLNLLEIAAQTGAEPLFELYRRQLSAAPLPAHLATAFQVNVGQAYRRFHHVDKARPYLERGLAMAERHGFHPYFFEAEAALKNLSAMTSPPRVPATLSLDTQEVASAIQQLRELAGAG